MGIWILVDLQCVPSFQHDGRGCIKMVPYEHIPHCLFLLVIFLSGKSDWKLCFPPSLFISFTLCHNIRPHHPPLPLCLFHEPALLIRMQFSCLLHVSHILVVNLMHNLPLSCRVMYWHARCCFDEVCCPSLQLTGDLQLLGGHDVVHGQEVFFQTVDQRYGELVVHHVLLCYHDQPGSPFQRDKANKPICTVGTQDVIFQRFSSLWKWESATCIYSFNKANSESEAM